MSLCVDELTDQLNELDGGLLVAVDGGNIFALDEDEHVVWSISVPAVEGVEIC